MPPVDLFAAAANEFPAVAAARAFVDGELLPTGLTPGVAAALVEALVERRDAPRLGRLAAEGDKATAKLARGGLHRLRSRGVDAPVPAPLAPAKVAVDGAATPLQALGSAIQGPGHRALWYPEVHPEGVLLCVVEIDEQIGVAHSEEYEVPRRAWRQVEEEVLRDPAALAARLPPAHVRWLIEEAYQRSLTVGDGSPRSFGEIRHRLRPAAAPAVHPAVPALAGLPVTRPLPEVMALPELATWTVDVTVIDAIGPQVEAIMASQLLVDGAQRRQQVFEISRRACAQALEGPWRARLQGRLLETAYLLHQRAATVSPREPRDLRGDGALCLAAARQLDDGAPADEAVVPWALFERLLGEVDFDGRPGPERPAPESAHQATVQGSRLILP